MNLKIKVENQLAVASVMKLKNLLQRLIIIRLKHLSIAGNIVLIAL